jgi:hypothetical protein
MGISDLNIIKKIKHEYAEKGIPGIWDVFCLYLVYYFKKYIFRKEVFHFLVWDLSRPLPDVVPGTKIELREIKLEDLDSFRGIVSEARIDIFRERIHKGTVGFMAVTSEGAIAGYGWLAQGNEYLPALGMHYRLQEDEGFSMDDFTVPEYRGNRVHALLLHERSKYLKSRGSRRMYGYHVSTNTASKNSMLRAGAVFIKIVNVYIVCGFKFRVQRLKEE